MIQFFAATIVLLVKMFCIFMLLMFIATSESFNVYTKIGIIIELPNNAGNNGNKSSFFGKFIQFQNKNDRLRLVVSAPRSTKTNFRLTSDPAFGQLYSCQTKLNLSNNSCNVLLASRSWSDTNGMTVAIDSEGDKVACNYNKEHTCLPKSVTSPGSCSRSSEHDENWRLIRSRNDHGARKERSCD